MRKFNIIAIIFMILAFCLSAQCAQYYSTFNGVHTAGNGIGVGATANSWGRWNVSGSGIVSATPVCTTGTAWTLSGTGITSGTGLSILGLACTSGNLLKLSADATLSTGNYINCLGGASADTPVFTVKASGATAISSTLSVAGATTFGSGYSGTGATLAALGAFSTRGAIVGASTLAITGASTLTGAATLGSTATGPGGGGIVYNKYQRITAAAINSAAATGIPLLAAVSGRQYRILNACLSAYGGAFTSTNATSLEIVSDPAGTPVVLYQVLKAQLARGTTAGVGFNNMNPTTASTVVLADNASFLAQVANKGISLITTTASTYDWATATGVDVWIQYSVD